LEKLLIHAHYTLTSGWCLCYLDGKCNVTWWPNLAFHCLFWSVIVSSSFLCGAKWYMMGELLLMVISFFFPFSLFSLRKCTTVLLAPCVSISILILLICYFHYFFNNSFFFQFNPSITISHMLFSSSRSLFFLFLIFFPWSFC